MRRTIIALLLLVVVAWSAPPQLEDVSGQCQALESQVLRQQARQFPDSSEDASVRAGIVAQRVAQYARDAYHSLPPGLGCFMVYAEILFDADLSMFQASVP